MVLMFLLGLVVGIGAVVVGAVLAVKLGSHFIATYVKKLTPDDLEKINQSAKFEIPEENLRALDIDETKYRKVMGWPEDGRLAPEDEGTDSTY